MTLTDTIAPLLQPGSSKTAQQRIVTDAEKVALAELTQKLPGLAPPGVDVSNVDSFCTPSTLLRYLRARKLNVEQAATMLRNTLAWRHESCPERLDYKELHTQAGNGHIYVHGHDKASRPVLYMIKRDQPGNEADVKLMLHCMETAAKCMPPGVDNVTIVGDLTLFGLANRTPLTVLREGLNLLTSHYPERLGVTYLVNAPTVYNVVFNVLYPLLDVNTRSKLKFVYLNPATMNDPTKNPLLQAIDESMLLEKYGGSCPYKFEPEAYAAAVDALHPRAAGPGKEAALVSCPTDQSSAPSAGMEAASAASAVPVAAS